METKTHWKKLNHPDYIGAYELMDGTENKELVVQIKKVSREMITGADGKKEECTVCHLQSHKPMILNATNQKVMAKLFGSPYIEDWAGKKMTLYVARIKAFGDMVDALRVRPTAPVGTKETALPELSPTHPKWNDAIAALKAGNTTIEKIVKSYLLSDENKQLLVESTLNK